MQLAQPDYDCFSFGTRGSKHDVDEGHGAQHSTPWVGFVGAVCFEDFAKLGVRELQGGGDKDSGYHNIAAVEEGMEFFEGGIFVSPYWFD